MASSTGWYRVSKSHPCVICGRPDWCGFSDDGVLACCMRMDGGAWKTAKNGGWIHKVAEAQIARPMPKRPPVQHAPTIDCVALQERFAYDLTAARVETLANALGVTYTALLQLDLGFDEQQDAYTFPMRSARGAITGFRLRNLAGRKWAVTGSRQGLFTPRYMIAAGPLVVVEGPTDAAALLSVGLAAIGRPSNTGGHEDLVAYCRGIRRQIVILHDRDAVGSDAERLTLHGALKLAAALQPNEVSISRPPFSKDARAWVNAGADHGMVMNVLRAANKFQPTGTEIGPLTDLKTAS